MTSTHFDGLLNGGAPTETNRLWVVWSFEHDAWWASNRHGYVQQLLLAGLYTESEAKGIERRANAHCKPNERKEEARSVELALEQERRYWGRSGPMVIDLVELSP